MPTDTAAPDDLPVEELHLDPADKSYMLAENAMLKQRVAELEAENAELRAALMPLETSSIASAVQEAAAATMQRDQLLAARAAVDAVLEELAVRAALHHWHADQWEGSHDEPEARGQWYGYSAAAGMLRDALSGGIAPASTRDDVLREICGQHVRWTRVCPARYDAAWCPFGMTLPCDRHNPDLSDEAARGQNAPCWLAHYGLASEYADACELWARADAAKGADDRYEQQQQPDRARNDG